MDTEIAHLFGTLPHVSKVISSRGIILDCPNIPTAALEGLMHWGRDTMDVIFQGTFSNAFSWMKISIRISLKFVPNVPTNNIPALVQ